VNVEPVREAAHDLQADLLAIAVGEDFATTLAEIDARFGGHLANLLAQRNFTGRNGSALSFWGLGWIPAREVLVIGVGDRSGDALAKAAGRAGRQARDSGARSLVVSFGALDAAQTALVLEMVHAGNYTYDAYKAEADRTPALESVHVDGAPEGLEAVSAAAGVRARWQSWARDLVNGPAAEVYPETFAARCAVFEDLEDVELEILDVDSLTQEGYVGILGVGQGSANPPRLVHVRYRPEGAVGHVCFVGKGVTFDSGGLSLKPSASMQTMRCDMAGAATAMAAFGAIAELRLPIAVDAIVGLAENMVSGSSYKLGDVLSYKNGVTVEIHNTDAEGRLVLADCLIRASEIDGVTDIVDLATLTGAIVVALGGDFTGMYTPDDTLAAELDAAAAAENEYIWRMPLHDPYKAWLKGEWGQIKNITGKPDAGSGTAALFLQYFVKGKRWAHLDIAGAAFNEKTTGPYFSGATGQMLRTLVTWAQRRAS
jgi:leucyl aminopeptidase